MGALSLKSKKTKTSPSCCSPGPGVRTRDKIRQLPPSSPPLSWTPPPFPSPPRALQYHSVGGQRQGPHGGPQLPLLGRWVAPPAVAHRPDLDVELFGFVVVKVRVAGEEAAVFLLGAACGRVKEQSAMGQG